MVVRTEPSPTYPRSEILPGVFLGDMEDALIFPGPKVSVHENPSTVPAGAHWVPILYGPEDAPKASRLMLDAATAIVRHYQRQKTPVLLHCAAGLERSPLTMAWFLRRYHYVKTLDEGYAFIRGERPSVFDRTLWLEEKERASPKSTDATRFQPRIPVKWSKKDHRNEWHCEHSDGSYGPGHGNHIHGCDGCCQDDSFPGKMTGSIPAESSPDFAGSQVESPSLVAGNLRIAAEPDNGVGAGLPSNPADSVPGCKEEVPNA